MVVDESGSRIRRLGFREIVPGADRVEPGSDEAAGPSQVPRLDLAAGLMANDRKLVAATRRGPGRGKKRMASDTDALQDALQEALQEAPQVVVATPGLDSQGPSKDSGAGAVQAVDAPRPACGRDLPVSLAGPTACDRVWHPALTDSQRKVIAEIVARDITRLCRGERVFFA
jgi:hypothetical protein